MKTEEIVALGFKITYESDWYTWFRLVDDKLILEFYLNKAIGKYFFGLVDSEDKIYYKQIVSIDQLRLLVGFITYPTQ